MPAEFRIVDADGHVMELDEQLAEYIGPPYDGLEWHRTLSFWPGLTMDGYLRSLRAPGGWAGGGTGPNAEDWLRFLDINGISAKLPNLRLSPPWPRQVRPVIWPPPGPAMPSNSIKSNWADRRALMMI